MTAALDPPDLFRENVRLAYTIANRFRESTTGTLWQDDLEQEALIGLWKACQNYDPARNDHFGRYAGQVVKNEIRMFLRRVYRWSQQVVSLDESIRETDDLKVDGLLLHEPDLEAGVRYEELVAAILATGSRPLINRLLHGRTNEELARETGVHSTKIARQYQRELRRLREVVA